MGLAYEPSWSDGRYHVSGKIESRSQILTKDSVLKKLLRQFFFAIVFYPL